MEISFLHVGGKEQGRWIKNFSNQSLANSNGGMLMTSTVDDGFFFFFLSKSDSFLLWRLICFIFHFIMMVWQSKLLFDWLL